MFSICLFYCNCRICQKLKLLSDFFITTCTTIKTNLKEKNMKAFCMYFFRNVVGIFCATCTVADYPWLHLYMYYCFKFILVCRNRADLGEGGEGGGGGRLLPLPPPPPSGIRPPADPKGPPFDTFSEIPFWPTDPKTFLKAPSASIYTNFERGPRAEKTQFFGQNFPKSA